MDRFYIDKEKVGNFSQRELAIRFDLRRETINSWFGNGLNIKSVFDNPEVVKLLDNDSKKRLREVSLEMFNRATTNLCSK